MMDLLRRSVSGWAGKIFLGLLLGVFAVAWTLADGFSGASSPNTVMSAGGTRVTIADYQLAYEQAVARVGQQIGRRPTQEEAAAFGIEGQVLSQLGAGAALDEQGRRIGLGLSDDGLARLIANDPSFHDASGNFSRNAFRTVLQNARLSENAYLERLGETALRSQIVEAVSEGVSAPEAAARALGLHAGERRNVDYFTVVPAAPETAGEPAPEQLDDFFAENLSDYAAPERRDVAYVVLEPAAFADAPAVTDEDVSAAYEASAQRFVTPERRRIQQIVFTDEAQAEAAASELAGGAAFEDVASGAGRVAADIDLGLLRRDAIPDAAIADAAFALAPNQPSGVVSGLFGPAILRVTEIAPEGVQPLAEVSAQLREEVALDRAVDAVNAAYEAFDGARGRGAEVEEAAAEAGLELRRVEGLSQAGTGPDDQPIEGLPAGGEFLQAVFTTEAGFDNAPLSFGEGSYVFYDVTAIEPSRERSLDEVRDRVLADWRQDEVEGLAADRAEALRARVEAGESLAAVAQAEGLTVSTASAITRSTGQADIGLAATRAAFAGPNGHVAASPARVPGQWILLAVTGVAAPADPFQNLPAGGAERISVALQNDLLQSYVTRLQGLYGVEYNTAVLGTLQGTPR